MRAPFNTTVDVYHGPGSTTPGALRGTCDARFVLADGITLIGLNAPNVFGWITLQDVTPIGSWTPGAMGFKPSIGDQIAMPSGASPSLWVCWVEEIFWGPQPLYVRAIVAPLPLPAECDCGNSDAGDGAGGEVVLEGEETPPIDLSDADGGEMVLEGEETPPIDLADEDGGEMICEGEETPPVVLIDEDGGEMILESEET